jgi:hypothetical protein
MLSSPKRLAKEVPPSHRVHAEDFYLHGSAPLVPGAKIKKRRVNLTRLSTSKTSSLPFSHQGSVESIPGDVSKSILFGAVDDVYQSTLYCHGTVLP